MAGGRGEKLGTIGRRPLAQRLFHAGDFKMTKKFGHGGARPGAGRPRMDPVKRAMRDARPSRRQRGEQSARSFGLDFDTLLAARLADAALPPEATDHDWHRYRYLDRARLWLAWRDRGAAVLARWIAQRPGTRPSCWWDFDAPRQAPGTWLGCYYDGKFPMARERVGGKGTPVFAVLGYVPEYEFGLPTRWVDDWSIAYYTGHAKDVNGNPIGEKYAGKDFGAEHFDRAEPPRFESQATYLRRLALLARGEEQRLTPDDFQTEPLPERYWPDNQERT
jgi:hypothetical protein